MNPDADTSDLFPDFSPIPQLVFVNNSVSLQTEADQRVILVHGVVYFHYSREDGTAEAYALVSLYESGYVDQRLLHANPALLPAAPALRRTERPRPL